jgi:acyl-CoA synthetase (AMP-forming)/AMP-acid ligase II
MYAIFSSNHSVQIWIQPFNHFFRHCVSAGEPLNEEVIEAWHDKTGLWIREGYGQTETTLIAATTKEMIIKPGSMGKAAPGTYLLTGLIFYQDYLG